MTIHLDTDFSIADDKIVGVNAIADEIRESPRRTYYLLDRKLIPAGKLGHVWIASRRALRQHYATLTQIAV